MDAADWDDKYRATDHLWSHGPNLFVADRLATTTPGRGLDLACGEGRNAAWLVERGWKMLGVDFSPVALDRAMAKSPDIEFVLGDVRVWEPETTFDLILIAYLHLGLDEFAEVVSKTRGWLEPGGELFIIGHDRSNIEHGHGGPQDPDILWDVPTIRGWMDGMRVIEAQVVRRPVDGAHALDTLVRARGPV